MNCRRQLRVFLRNDVIQGINGRRRQAVMELLPQA